jgi:hypothetical protein
MNDRKLLRDASNGIISNVAAALIVVLAVVLAIVSIPLAVVGGS